MWESGMNTVDLFSQKWGNYKIAIPLSDTRGQIFLNSGHEKEQTLTINRQDVAYVALTLGEANCIIPDSWWLFYNLSESA